MRSPRRWPILAVASLIMTLVAPVLAGHPVARGAGEARPSWADIPSSVLKQFDDKDSGRYLVLLDARADLSTLASIRNRDARRRAVVNALHETATQSQEPLAELLERGRTTGAVDSFQPFWVVNAIAVRSNEQFLRQVASLPGVEKIVPDQRRQIVRSTREQTVRAQVAAVEWNVERVGAPDAWAAGVTGSGIVVANLDTGVDWLHPSVATKYRGADGDHNYDWWDAIDGETVPYDDNDHGTHTMGTMVGGDGPGPDPNDIGVAYGATWIAAKAFDQFGGGTDSWILGAGQFLTAPTRLDGTNPSPELAPDVINNSWGGGWCDSTFGDMVDAWRVMGIFPAFAIGNSGPSSGSAGSPGDDPDSFAVGATDDSDEIAEFSSRGPSCYEETKPEISAPGVDVRSSVAGGGFDSFSGTSMATPHVAGAVALMDEASADAATVDDLESALIETALDLGNPGPDSTYGAGRLQTYEAVLLMARGGVLEGSVSGPTGEPVPGASITLETPGLPLRRVTTDATGHYRVWAATGTYALTAQAFGYLPASESVAIAEGSTTTLDLSLELAPVFTLSGTVRETPGDLALAGATVTVVDTPLAPVTSDAVGAYSLEVPAGTYDVAVERDGCRSGAQDEVVIDADVVHDVALDRKLDSSGYVCDSVAIGDDLGTARLDLSGDDNVKRVDLPFAFDFFGQTGMEAWVSTNGYVSFEPPSDSSTAGPDWVNRPIPDAAPPNNAVYALWDDLAVRGSARGVYTSTLGDAPARRFVIEYRNFEVQATGDLVNFSVVLFESGAIETRYRRLEGEGDGRGATVGVESPGGRSGLQFSVDEPTLRDGMAVRYFTSDQVGFLAGTVKTAADGVPIEGAKVSAGGRSASSDEEGRYRLALYPGTHAVEVTSEGYDTETSTVEVAVGEVTPLDAGMRGPRLVVAPSNIALASSGEPQATNVAISSIGEHPVDFAVTALAPVPLHDPVGDAIDGLVDVAAVRAQPFNDALFMQLDFSPSTPMNRVFGFIHLDTDRDPATGRPPDDLYGKPEQNIGFEYFLVVDGDWESVGIYDQDYDWRGWVPAEVSGAAFRFNLPLDLIDDDGLLDYTTVLGDWYGPTDWAPDAGHASAGDRSWISASPGSGHLVPGLATDVGITATPSGMGTGDHNGLVVVSSNDPMSPSVIDVKLTIDGRDPPSTTITTGNGAVLVWRIQDLQGVSSDGASGVQSVEVRFRTAPPVMTTTVQAVLACDEDGTVCEWRATPPAVPGRYTATASAKDREGHVESPGPSVTIVVV